MVRTNWSRSVHMCGVVGWGGGAGRVCSGAESGMRAKGIKNGARVLVLSSPLSPVLVWTSEAQRC